jgi:hypothetical protein
MARYYVNDKPQANGDHEVHRDTCSYLPSDRTYLGDFSRCQEAVAAAKLRYRSADGCYWCSPDCHRK